MFKILGDLIGYEIHDGDGKLIFKIQTHFERIDDLDEDFFVTTIKANFYDKNGTLVFSANTGEADEKITVNTKYMIGFNGAFGITVGYDEEELEFLRYILHSKGKVNEPIRGVIENEDINLDGKAIQNATLNNCRITVSSTDFIVIGPRNKFNKCQFNFKDDAATLIDMVNKIKMK